MTQLRGYGYNDDTAAVGIGLQLDQLGTAGLDSLFVHGDQGRQGDLRDKQAPQRLCDHRLGAFAHLIAKTANSSFWPLSRLDGNHTLGSVPGSRLLANTLRCNA